MSLKKITNDSIIIILIFIIVGGFYLLFEYDNQLVSGVSVLPNSTASNLSLYQNSSFGIRIQYPSEWKQIEDFQGSWFRNTNESVNVRAESIIFPSGSLDDLTTRQLNLTKHQFPGQKVIESNKTTIGDNYTAHKIVFTFPEEPNDPRKILFKEMQVLTLNGTRSFIISYFTRADSYDYYLPVIQKIIDSFRITPISS